MQVSNILNNEVLQTVSYSCLVVVSIAWRSDGVLITTSYKCGPEDSSVRTWLSCIFGSFVVSDVLHDMDHVTYKKSVL